jgi:hypothetical protein
MLILKKNYLIIRGGSGKNRKENNPNVPTNKKV